MDPLILSSIALALAVGSAGGAIATKLRLRRMQRRLRRAEGIAKDAVAQTAFLRNIVLRNRVPQGAVHPSSPTLPLCFRSQFGEDALLFELFAGQSTGFFIEVGAYDGLSFSVSAAFESLGWSGLLVEATPARAAECKVNRPGSRVIHAALGAPDSPPTATFRIGVNRAKEGETSGSDMLSHLDTAAAHASRSESSRRFETITVPMMTLSAALGNLPVLIDFASIDVEGGEWNLLQGLDLTKHRPRVMLIEQGSGPNDPDARRISEHLKANRYTSPGAYMGNALFVDERETQIIDRARALLGVLAHR